MDLSGRISKASLGGANYYLAIVDDFSRYLWTYALKNKSNVLPTFQLWHKMVERESGYKLVRMKSDNGTEFCSTSFHTYLSASGITHQTTVPFSPEMNGVSERQMRSVAEGIRAMLFGGGFPVSFWAELLATHTYLRNRWPTKLLSSQTPHEAWFGVKPRVSHLRRIGCKAYSHVPKQKRNKFDVKAEKCILIGYGTSCHGYQLYNPATKTFHYARDVIFDELSTGFQPGCPSIEFTGGEPLADLSPVDVMAANDSKTIYHENDPCWGSVPSSLIPSPVTDEPIVHSRLSPPPSTRPQRVKNPPDRFGDWVNLGVNNSIEEPSSFTAAMKSPQSDLWMSAMLDELASFSEQNVWELVDIPPGHSTVSIKWIFKVKVGEDGQVERYKARLVGRGFSQRYGENVFETFSPVARFDSVRTLLAVAVQYDLLLTQYDVKTAFLHGNLDEEIYVSQPEGFVLKGCENKVYRLKRSLYGLRQSPRCWNKTLHDVFLSLGFKQFGADPCVYSRGSISSTVVFATVWVDDILPCFK